ncbi:formylglycine-generating enzyme family protein, partial [Bacteroides sp. UBA939]|uniref:formylglycine-generating enzyme family protein n=1 Tax=Bacteroides sp. UBA939 TaxID=1946092 RepID=UPI0025C2314E
MKRNFLFFTAMIIALSSMYGQQLDRQNADKFFDEGKYETAKGHYLLYKGLDPNGRDYADKRIAQCEKCNQLITVANYLWTDGQQAKAIAQYREILAINPKDPVARTRAGNSTTAPSTTTVPRHPAEPEMVYVQGGTFRMGSESGFDDEKPVHQVTVSSFYIGKYEVTQAQWRSVMGTNPSHFKGDNLPVESVSWTEAREFASRLSTATGKRYRLPTEAEWEYAARGGNKSQGYTYSGSNTLGNVAWYYDNSGNTTHSVGTKSPNELGIYD